ncbi:cation:proton antiporter regulatory subunit [Salarchaeum sp. JOR-1]|uniref:cation:proton antiporter regulatory subunit n=1 Tax=Salarchaeum sp. JOR-1 TaxID=2599399 RepID=UPI00119832CB|nr:TrkA C-terminal domain-containing protein [Salarchaeum sp. JOR-1]QDX41006.1 potassium transporter TrkA [Salarchaeum sp. JOR-1]
MRVYETDIPGVGRRFELPLAGDASVVVVLHHDGRCELYRRDNPDADGEKILDLSGEQANTLGSILEGAYFESVDVDELTVPLGDAIIEWVEVTADSPITGETLSSAGIREGTGVTIIAIQRGDDTVSNPGPDFELTEGDILVGVGTREEHTAFSDTVTPDE